MHPTDYLQFVVALVFVLGLIGLTSLLLRRFGPGGLAAGRPRAGSARRLSLVESLPLDPRHRLVIVRYDDKEAVLVLGAQADTVLETALPAVTDAEKASASTQGGTFDAVIRRIGAARGQKAAEAEKPSDQEAAS